MSFDEIFDLTELECIFIFYNNKSPQRVSDFLQRQRFLLAAQHEQGLMLHVCVKKMCLLFNIFIYFLVCKGPSYRTTMPGWWQGAPCLRTHDRYGIIGAGFQASDFVKKMSGGLPYRRTTLPIYILERV